MNVLNCEQNYQAYGGKIPPVPWNSSVALFPETSFFGNHAANSVALTRRSLKGSDSCLEVWHATGERLHQVKATMITEGNISSSTGVLICEIDSTSVHQIELLGSLDILEPLCMAVTVGGTAAVLSSQQDSHLKLISSHIGFPKNRNSIDKIKLAITHPISQNFAFLLSESKELGSWHADGGSECTKIAPIEKLCGDCGNGDHLWSCKAALHPLVLWSGHHNQNSVWKLDTRSRNTTNPPYFAWLGDRGCDSIHQCPRVTSPYILVGSGDRMLMFDERWPSQPLSSWWQHTVGADSGHMLQPVSHVSGTSLDGDMLVGYSKQSVFNNLHAIPRSALVPSMASSVLPMLGVARDLLSGSCRNRIPAISSKSQPSFDDGLLHLVSSPGFLGSPVDAPHQHSPFSTFIEQANIGKSNKLSSLMVGAMSRADPSVPLAGLAATFKSPSQPNDVCLLVVQLSMVGDLSVSEWPSPSSTTQPIPTASAAREYREPSTIQPAKRLCVTIPNTSDVSESAEIEERAAQQFILQLEPKIRQLLVAHPRTLKELATMLSEEVGGSSDQLLSLLAAALKQLPGVECTKTSEIKCAPTLTGRVRDTSVSSNVDSALCDIYWIACPPLDQNQNPHSDLLTKLQALAQEY